MWRQCIGFALLIVALTLGSAQGAFNPLTDPAIVGWWACDEGTGTIVGDSSPNARNGTIVEGDPLWAEGVYGSAVELKGSLVKIPAVNINMTQATMAGWVKPIGSQAAWSAVMMTRGSATGLNVNPDTGNLALAYHWGDASTTWGYRPTATLVDNEWSFVAVTIAPDKAIFYLDGVAVSTNAAAHGAVNWNADVYLGGDGSGSFATRRFTDAMLDDVSLFSRALTAEEIQEIMKGLTDPALAGKPYPADTATDVPQDVALNWTAGETATAHNVYFGASLEDVTAAAASVLVSQNQTDAEFDPDGLLEFGQTYYWRVDEITADGTVFAGTVWSFTVEPRTYAIANITATASSFQTNMGPENTVNGSGLDALDQHSTELKQMWMSAGVMPNWIQYEFDGVYKLDELMVWNSNQLIEPLIGFGAKDVTIEYSTDGQTWATMENVPEFAMATGAKTYTANTIVDCGGVVAKFVKLTINASWSGLPQTGLAEVRFLYLPVQAREPSPADGATDVSISETLNWRPGREATSHAVYFGADSNAVAAGTVAAETVTGHTFTPAGMEYGIQYFWRVDEVGDAGTYAGGVWNFTSQEFAIAEDFESYNDDDNRIYDTWLDGIATGASNSTIGYMEAPFAEKTVVHAGKQSMPMAYDNTISPYISEGEREFEAAQNWTGNGASEISVWTRGYPAPTAVAVTETGGKMSLTGAGADIWNNSDEFTYAYKTLTGDGTLIARVVSNGTGTNTWAKGGVMIRDSVNGGSMHAMMVITGATSSGNGASFQYRATTNGASANTDSTVVIAPPYWVKIERSGSTLTGFHSADGKTWSTLGTTIIEMEDPVMIGLCVTSHAAGEDRTYEFDNITATGTVSGAWQGAVINSAQYNDAASMYLTVEDSAGKSATVTSDTAALTAAWTRWAIPMSDFAGV
ncbi:MAG: LamG-like jellyroll fold domain-containing protein, partial [Solirubrobacterales bacterium]